METNSIVKIFFKYCRQKVYILSLLILIIATFSIVCTLYNVPIDAIIYACILSVFFLFVLMIFDFIRYYRDYKKIIHLYTYVDISLDTLPKTNSLIDQSYQHLIISLHEQYRTIAYQNDSNYKELLNYYTLWVHQIKTPISAMKLLLDTDSFDNSDKLMELQRIEQYVEMVLHFLRLESMSGDLVIKEYDLHVLLKQVIKKHATFFITKKINLQLEDIRVLVLTDEKWLSFVLEQILSNSLKYTNVGTISIYMDPIKQKTLVIEDTGIGIQEEDLPRIFERGFTGYNGRINRKSTGIGLYLCKEVLANLNHPITITSSIHVGTKVSIDFYRKKVLYD